VKKLISIGVALALLTMAVVPGAVAAYTPPETYSKVPFAIVEAGFELVGNLLDTLGAEFGLPEYLDSGLMTAIGEFAGGPMSWTVDMLAWGLEMAAEVYVLADDAFDIGFPVVGDILYIMSCKLLTCWSATNCTGTFEPCAFVP
jgi:hypothetical protein